MPSLPLCGKQKTRKILLLACSALKSRNLVTGPASSIYIGTMVVGGLRWAKENGYEVLILSAKYGWITPDTIIETYNLKLKKKFQGPWPDGEGHYLGGQLYFGNAPSRFTPLVTGSCGIVRGKLNALVGGGATIKAEGTVTKVILDTLLAGPVDKVTLSKILLQKCGPHPTGYRRTINSQLSAPRQAKENLVTLKKKNSHFGIQYWFEPIPTKRKLARALPNEDE